MEALLQGPIRARSWARAVSIQGEPSIRAPAAFTGVEDFRPVTVDSIAAVVEAVDSMVAVVVEDPTAAVAVAIAKPS